MAEAPKDPRFQYPDVPEAAVPVATLDKMMAWLLKDEAVGWVGWVSTGLKIGTIALYFWARDKAIAMGMARAKQQYEQDQANKNQDEVDQDDPARRTS